MWTLKQRLKWFKFMIKMLYLVINFILFIEKCVKNFILCKLAPFMGSETKIQAVEIKSSLEIFAI